MHGIFEEFAKYATYSIKPMRIKSKNKNKDEFNATTAYMLSNDLCKMVVVEAIDTNLVSELHS